jgi:hypothetical protein
MASIATRPADEESITELEKFGPERVDGVGVPANGFPILMMKSLTDGRAAVQAPTSTTEEGHIAAAMTEPDRQYAAVDDGVRAAPAAKSGVETVMVEMPADMSVSVSPANLAKLATFKRRLAIEQTTEGSALKRDMDPNVGGGVDRDKIPAEDFAGPDRSFPIVTPKDVADINPNLNHPDIKGDPEAIKHKAMAIARRKGPEFEAKIPDSWKTGGKGEDAKKTADEDESDAAKAKKPFKGAAPPFKKKDDEDEAGGDGEENDGEGDGEEAKPEDEEATKAMACKGCEAPMAKGANFCSACGAPADEKAAKAGKPFPADAAVEAAIDRLEHDAETAIAAQAKDPDAATHPADRVVSEELARVKDDVQAAAAAQAKDEETDSAAEHATKAAGEPAAYHLARLHDATCAAFHGDDVIAAHPAASKGIAHIADPDTFATEISAALTGGDATSAATALPGLSYAYSLSATLKAAEPDLIAEAMDGLRKAFSDMYPDAHPKPGSINPGEFHRPYIGSGRANQSAGSGQKPRTPMASHVPAPEDFRRPLITAGREGASPGSATKAGRTYYTNAAREQATGVLTAMHDYIVGQHPGVCAMTTATYDGEAAVPGSMGSSLTTSAPTPERFGKTNAASSPVPVDPAHAASVVTPSVTKAQEKEEEMATASNLAPEATDQAATPSPAPAPAPIDPEVIKAALRDLVAEQFGDLTKTIGDHDERLAELEAAPDPEQMTPRGGAAALTKARNDGREVPAGGDEAARTGRLVRLVKQAKDPDQGISLPAIDELMKSAGRELAVKLLA